MNRMRSMAFSMTFVMAFALCTCGSATDRGVAGSEPTVAVPDEKALALTIVAPGDSEDHIAPGRHFKVSGSIEGDVPDDAILRVSMIAADGTEIRYAQTEEKGTEHVSIDWYEGPVVVFDEETPLADIAYTAPELVVENIGDPAASARNADIKAVYTNDTFAALISCATDTEHGLADPDSYRLIDGDGQILEAFPDGDYTVRAVLKDVAGTELASAEKDITIGWKNGTVVHEITDPDIIGRGGMDLLMGWADSREYTVLSDLLPGMFGPYYQMTTIDMSYAAEKAEYLGSSIHTLLYNIHHSSTAYCMEMGNFMQRQHTVEDYRLAYYYAFDLGEPSLQGQPARIEALDPEQKIHILRIDGVTEEAEDGRFLTTEEQMVNSDTTGEDGWTVSAQDDFAIMGVVIPYQLKDEELVDNRDTYGYCDYLNNVAGMEYCILDVSDGEQYGEMRSTGLKRVTADPDRTPEASVYEFYNVFSSEMLESGHSYEISMQGFDRNGEAIPGMAYRFQTQAE